MKPLKLLRTNYFSRDEFVNLLNLGVKNCHFIFNGKFYDQIDGVEYSVVQSFFRQFSMGFTYFRSVSCSVKLDPNFSICITQLQTIINVYYARLYDSQRCH